MFNIVELQDVVRIDPEHFDKSVNEAARLILKGKYESIISPELGYSILILYVKADLDGKVVPGDGATYHNVVFKILTYLPKIQEIIEGDVVEITDFGAFIRVGPTDALLHLSQITDDYLSSDVRQGVLTANESGRTIKVGTKIRARITAVSLGRGASMGKVGVTCRQPFLGAVDWIEEDISKTLKSNQSKDTNKE